jgi:cell division protein FtsN
MKPKKYQAKKRHYLLWIIIGVIVLLAAGFGLYVQMGLKRQPPIAMQAVVRLKIPSKVDTPIMIPPEKPSVQPENAQVDSGVAVARDSSLEGLSSPAVNAAPDVRQIIPDRPESDNSMPPLTANAPAGAGEIAIEKQEPSESADNRTPVSGSSDGKPLAAEDEPQSISSPELDAGQTTTLEAPQLAPAQQVQADPGIGSSATQNSTSQADVEQSAPFTIQVGAYLTKTYAERTVSQLVEKGYDAYLFQRTDKKQRLWYIVRFGHFQDRVAASQVLATFKDQEHMEASLAITN